MRGRQSCAPSHKPETPAGHTLPLRSHSHSLSRSHSLTLRRLTRSFPPGHVLETRRVPWLRTVLCVGAGGEGRLPQPRSQGASSPRLSGPRLPAKAASQGSWGLGSGGWGEVQRKGGPGENSLSPSSCSGPQKEGRPERDPSRASEGAPGPTGLRGRESKITV